MLFRFLVTIIFSVVGFFAVPILIVLALAAFAVAAASGVLFLCALGSGIEWYLHPHSHHFMVNTLGFLGESLMPWLILCAGWFFIAEISGVHLQNIGDIELERDADFDPSVPARR